MLRGFAEDLKHEFRGYNSAALMKDLMAGLTVTAVALPLALAFGVSSGADAASGLITAIIAGLVMSLLAGGYYQISGPTGAMAAILTSLVAGYGLDGVFIATLLAGILLLLAGILRLGKLTSFIPAPVYPQALPPVLPSSLLWGRSITSSAPTAKAPQPLPNWQATAHWASIPI